MSIRYAKVLNPAQSRDLRLIPGRYKTFFSAPKHPDRLWLDFYLKGKRDTFSVDKAAGSWSSRLTSLYSRS